MKKLPKVIRENLEKNLREYEADALGFCDECKDRAVLLLFGKYRDMTDAELWEKYQDEKVNMQEHYHGNIGTGCPSA